MYKIDKLLKLDEKLFHTQDLAIIWGIENKNTLYKTINRYVKKDILIPIHKGFYSTTLLEKINPIRLGIGYLHTFAYLSCESVLIKDGVIFQKENYITLVSSVSRKFTIGGNNFLVRKMKEEFLYNDCEIEDKDGVKTASLERAVVDLLYFNPRYHFDNPKKINWRKVREIRKVMG